MKGRGNGQDCTDLQSKAGPARSGGECIDGRLCDGSGCECVNLSPMPNIQSDSLMSCKEQQQHRHVPTSSQVALGASKKSSGETCGDASDIRFPLVFALPPSVWYYAL